MTVTFELDPEVTDELRTRLVALWTDVTNAGGAVGFVPPVTEDDIRPDADKRLAGIAGGQTRLLAAYDGDLLAGTAFYTFNTHRLMRHWAWVYSVMVHPSCQGRGLGRELMGEVERRGRGMGLQALKLTCRGGLGLERFYESAGYKEVGRVPAAIRVGPGDDRDDVTMWLPLE